MTKNMHLKKPTIWAHAASTSGVDALREVLMRAQIIEPSLSYRISVPASANIYESSVTVLQNTGSSSGLNFLKETIPDLCLWSEDSINTPLFNLHRKFSHPVVLINPKTRELLERPWIWRKTVVRQVLRSVCNAFTEQIDGAKDLRSLGLQAKKIEVLGPLLSGVVVPICDEAERDRIGELLAARPVWFANQVPPQEIRLVLEAFLKAQRNAHRLLLILDLAQQSSISAFNDISLEMNLISHSRSVEGEPEHSTQIFLTDGSSEIGLWYRLATLSYMGGSFTNGKVPNPLVAAALGSAVVHGPKVDMFKDFYMRMEKGNAIIVLKTEHDLSSQVAALMAPDKCADIAARGWKVVSDGAVAIDRLVDFTLAKMKLEE
jgi:3-deoxy-D-manno-octulosonic-acid transferase